MRTGQTMVEYVLVLAGMLMLSVVFAYFFRAVYRHETETVALLSAGVP
ncbi:MAG: hypothetical protein IKP97_01905 [Kiritimatiellae bacterium]|jgi:hypothetical protein|nr:hypothetical protein [Kiritimatiellia bacterium]